MRRRDWLFILATVAALAVALPSLYELLRPRLRSEFYSHIVLVPLVSAYAIFRRRKEMFRGTASAHPWGVAAVSAGIGLAALSWFAGRELDVRASLATLGALLLWCGTYIVLYGKGGSRRAYFPLAFLLFAVPVPALVMDKIIAVLVVGSAYMTRLLFVLMRVPFVQEGPIFYLPGFFIEVAHVCSGIRSSMALLITAVLAGHIFLRTFRNKVLLALAVLPVALFKNGVRIVTLYLLSYLVDIRIISGGFLHRSGGFLFFGVGLVVLGVVLWALRGRESRNSARKIP